MSSSHPQDVTPQGKPAELTLEHVARLPDLRTAAVQPPGAYVVQYDETGVDGPVARILGVFSSETSARDALRELDRTRSLVVHASITSWTVDVPCARTRVEIDL